MSLEADYFITENGLPNILLNSSKNRHSTMIRKTSTTSHDNQQTSNTVQVPHRNISRSISKSIKDSLNNRIKDGSASCKKTTEILSTSKSTTTTKSDNESNRNFKRWLTYLHTIHIHAVNIFNLLLFKQRKLFCLFRLYCGSLSRHIHIFMY